jgi:DNA polymerase I-like protein with 3'-5' exonuclease and polymerase domains
MDDECVFVFPEEKCEEYTQIVTDVMVESAEKFTMPYGVHCEVSPAIGDVWVKD